MRIGPSFRRAVAASVGLHALLALAIVLVARWEGNGRGAAPCRGIDTRVEVRLRFVPEPLEDPVEAPVLTARPDPAPKEPVTPPEPSPDSRPPVVQAVRVPPTLPPELMALLRRPTADEPAVSAPVESPAAPSAPAPVMPAGGTATGPTTPGPPGPMPIHGALAPGQSIVYVLDASGSMGEWGKFDVARRALIETLRSQPEMVRFQLVVYSGTAELPLRVRGRSLLAATAANVKQLAATLASLGPPSGRSNHIEALRTALELQPDVVLILTDAAEWPAANVRGLMKTAPRPASVCVARVTSQGVATPTEVK